MKITDEARRLIAAARSWTPEEVSASPVGAHQTIDRLASELEAALTESESVTAVDWEYGIQRDATSPMPNRKQAEQEIERQRTRPRGYRITTQRLVRRRVTAWEPVENTEEDSRG